MGMKEMQPEDGKSRVCVNSDFELSFDVEDNEEVIDMDFFLVGDLKFLFVVLGRLLVLSDDSGRVEEKACGFRFG